MLAAPCAAQVSKELQELSANICKYLLINNLVGD
jgi:hypothetical protein